MNQTWKKNFFTIWTGQAISQFSSSVLQFAIIWYLTDKTGSALVLSAATLMAFLPQGLLGPVIGVLIDRYDRKKIMVLADLFIAGVSTVLIFAGFWGDPPVWLILLVLFLRSLGTAFHNPCLQAVTPLLVPEDQLTRCAGYSQSLESISLLISPAAAAVLYSIWSLSGIILLDVFGALAAIFSLWHSNIPPLPPHPAAHPRVLHEALEGLSILRSNRGLTGLVLVGALYSAAMMPVSALFPLICMGYFGGTSFHASGAEIAFSVGLLLGSLVLSAWGGSRNKIYTIFASFVLLSISLIGSGLLPPQGFSWFLFCAVLMGFSGPFYWGMYTPLLQQGFEHRYLGRILSLSSSIRVISAPVGMAVSGVFAQVFGVEKWFLVAGFLIILCGMLCISIPTIRNCEHPI